LKRKDLWWILAYPLYQLIGTLRHEASHALAAVMQGARITEFVIWPTRGRWGYVNWEGSVTPAVMAAPYICDLLTFLVFFLVCMVIRFDKRRWIWLNGIALGIISPLVNSAYNYWGGLRGPNDVGKLFETMNPAMVHGYFWLTIGVYLAGLFLTFTESRMARA
jgi:hypothetical protein